MASAATSPTLTSGPLFCVFDPGPPLSHPQCYFAVVLNACGAPTIRLTIMLARSRKFDGVP